MTDTPCALAEKLYTRSKGYNFRFLTTELRLNEIHDRILKATSKSSQSFMLFVFKEKDEMGQEILFSITDFEILINQNLLEIIKLVFQKNGACIRVRFMNNLIVDKEFRKMTLDKVDELNKASSKLLDKQYREIIGFAELMDVTDEYRLQYSFLNQCRSL